MIRTSARTVWLKKNGEVKGNDEVMLPNTFAVSQVSSAIPHCEASAVQRGLSGLDTAKGKASLMTESDTQAHTV